MKTFTSITTALGAITVAGSLQLATAPAAVAQTAAAQSQVRVGMEVVDTYSRPVGTVTAIRGQELTIKTDRHEARLPISSFTPDKGQLLFALTRNQLNAQIDRELAAAKASLVAGAQVLGKGGNVAGRIQAIDDASVTIELTGGDLIRLPRTSVAPASNGVVLGVSVEELQQLAAQAQAQAGN